MVKRVVAVEMTCETIAVTAVDGKPVTINLTKNN